MATIAERLHHLVETHRRPNGKRWSIRQIEAGVAQRGFVGTTRNVIETLLNGSVTDPKMSHLLALAEFFGVPVTYFLESQDAIAEEDALISRAMQDRQIRRIVVETARLSADGQANVTRLYPIVLRLLQEEREQQPPSS